MYNLGECKRRAEAARATNSLPRPNYFGIFVQHYLSDISKSIAVPKIEDQKSTNAEVAKILPKSLQAKETLKMGLKLSKSVALSTMPPQCRSEGPGEIGTYEKIISLDAGKKLGSASGFYDVISVGIDCDLTDWSLIRTTDGKIGWVAKDRLTANSEAALEPKSKACRTGASEKCLASMAAKGLKWTDLGTNDNGEQEIQLIGKTDLPNDVNFKSFSSGCLGAQALYGFSPQSSDRPISANEAKDYLLKIENKKLEIISSFKFSSWEDPDNIYRLKMDGIVHQIKESCTYGCQTQRERLDELLETKASGYMGLEGFKKFFGNSTTYFRASAAKPDGDQSTDKAPVPNIKAWSDYVEKIRWQCEPLFSSSPENKKIFDSLVDGIESIKKHGFAVQDFNSSKPYVSEICSVGVRLKESKSYKKVDPNLDFGPSGCEQCYLQMTFPQGSNGSLSGFVSLKSLFKAIQSKADFDELLKSSLTSMSGGLGISSSATGSDSKYCKYDPIKSVKLVQSLMQEKCVEAVFVPDVYILKSLKEKSNKLFYKSFDSDDRFSVRFAGECKK